MASNRNAILFLNDPLGETEMVICSSGGGGGGGGLTWEVEFTD